MGTNDPTLVLGILFNEAVVLHQRQNGPRNVTFVPDVARVDTETSTQLDIRQSIDSRVGEFLEDRPFNSASAIWARSYEVTAVSSHGLLIRLSACFEQIGLGSYY